MFDTKGLFLFFFFFIAQNSPAESCQATRAITFNLTSLQQWSKVQNNKDLE